MADPVWPADLPAILVGSNYNYKGVDPFARTNMDGGLARQRRRFLNTPKNIAATWLFTTAQLEVFETFWEQQLGEGTLWFVVPLYNGRGEISVRARFTEAYQSNGVDGATDKFNVQGKLESLALRVTT
jgi:hypothetical protein